MNQILLYSFKQNKFKGILLLIFFIILIILIMSLLFYLIIHYFSVERNKELANSLMVSYNISALYSHSSNYSISDSININPTIIGSIEINKINLRYPIISTANPENLKKSICRFAGPMPNEIGNLCLAGHNYVNNTFFGKLYLIDMNDEIKIFDNNGNFIRYSVFKKFEVSKFDFSCTSQLTYGDKMITLMTCNTLNDKRKILVAKEVK